MFIDSTPIFVCFFVSALKKVPMLPINPGQHTPPFVVFKKKLHQRHFPCLVIVPLHPMLFIPESSLLVGRG